MLKLVYVPVLAGSMALMFARLLVMARLLEVEQFAVLNLALLTSSLVGMMSAFGLFLDLQRTLPVHLELGRRDEAAAQIMLAMAGSIAVSIVALLAAVLAGQIFTLSVPVALVGIIHGLSQQAFLIASTESRSNGQPVRYGLQNLARAVAVMLVGVPVAIGTGSALLVLVAEAVVGAIIVAVILRRTYASLGNRILPSLRRAIGSLPEVKWASMLWLVLVSLSSTLSTYIDRWLATVMLTAREFAQYTFAGIVLTIGFSVQALVNASVFPIIAKRRAVHGQRAAFRLTMITSIAVMAGCAIAAIPGLLIADGAIQALYPQYGDAAQLLPALTVAAILRVADFWSSYLIISGYERRVLLLNILALVGGPLLWYGLTMGSPSTQMDLALLVAIIAASIYFLTAVQSFYVTFWTNRS